MASAPYLEKIHSQTLCGTNLSKINLEKLMRIDDKKSVTFTDVPTPVPQQFHCELKMLKFNKLKRQFSLGRATIF